MSFSGVFCCTGDRHSSTKLGSVNICLRHGCAVARLMGLWLRIPAGGWMSVVRVLCCQSDVSALGRSLVQSSPTDCGVSSECNLKILTIRRSRPIGALEPWKIN